MAAHIQVRPGGVLTPLPGRPDIAVPELNAEVDDPSIPYTLQLTVAVVHGKPVCTSLTANRRPDGAPVTRRGLNAIPVERLVRFAASSVAARVVGRGPGFISYDLYGCRGGRRARAA
jgi:hypothetical protein